MQTLRKLPIARPNRPSTDSSSASSGPGRSRARHRPPPRRRFVGQRPQCRFRSQLHLAGRGLQREDEAVRVGGNGAQGAGSHQVRPRDRRAADARPVLRRRAAAASPWRPWRRAAAGAASRPCAPSRCRPTRPGSGTAAARCCALPLRRVSTAASGLRNQARAGHPAARVRTTRPQSCSRVAPSSARTRCPACTPTCRRRLQALLEQLRSARSGRPGPSGFDS